MEQQGCLSGQGYKVDRGAQTSRSSELKTLVSSQMILQAVCGPLMVSGSFILTCLILHVKMIA